jgi:hypothetical protein
MTKLGIRKRTFQDALKEHKSATTNRPGGLAFDFENPAEYLLATIGSALFVEPKYHPDTLNPKDLREGNYNVEDLDEQAVKIIEACKEIARGPSPRDLLALAHWARVEMNMRTTPQVMLAVAANCVGTKPFVRRYVSRISRRADDVLQVVAAYEHLFGWKAFPASLKKGIADRMSKLSEYEILKYNRKGHPSFKDLLRFCERRKNYPLSSELRHYIFTGEVINPRVTPMIAARKELTSRNTWGDDIPELAKRAGTTWEVLVSQFGSKPEVWAAVIPLMPYMALIRNVGNFLDAEMPLATIRMVANRIANAKAVEKSKQLPFRFMSLYRTLNPAGTWFSQIRGYGGSTKRNRSAWDQRSVSLLLEAVETALDHSVNNIPELPGISCIASDNSGSMSYPISKGSSVTLMDTANILGAMVHKRAEESYIASFGNKAVWPLLSKRNSVITNMNEIATFKANYRGHATNAYEVFKHLFEQKIHVDRIIILSDMQCYDTGGNRSVAQYLAMYRREINPEAFAHFFDLKGYGTQQMPSGDPRSNVVAGFSEKIFQQVLMFEGVEEVKGERVLPTLEYIREKY